ncbi:MAG: tetratricopeptide repeat protein [Thermoguttaceae bacterium]|nr:tetratricopeptide repeat protein [Thermoguttaceae bacterium]
MPLGREGVAAFERGDYHEAEQKLGEAVKLNDSDVEICRYYGETLWRLGKREEALETLRIAAEKHGPIEDEAAVCRSLGEKALEMDDPKTAAVWANKVIDLAPRSDVGWELRGRAAQRLGYSAEALNDFQRAVHFSKDGREILREIAILQNEAGDFDAALATWQHLERLYPARREPPEIFAGKGEAYLGLGMLDEAQNAFQIALKASPNDPRFQRLLAETASLTNERQNIMR